MGRLRTKIEIKLKSDICVSSGQAYAGIIDTDACFNENGFPYIPAKRIKGIMREAAEMLGVDNIDALFGVGGSGNDEQGNHCIYLNDAVIEKTKGINETISNRRKRNKNSCLTEQNIINLFSSVKAQTRLDENGVALDNTLRYTRVVNQYMPKCIDMAQEEIEFSAPIEYNEDDQENIKNIILAVRHIGMDRNRGLGNVKCSLSENVISVDTDIDKLKPNDGSDDLVKINYTLTNTSPLIISTSKDDITESYIGGSVILGALASLYLKAMNIYEPDETFNDIFLSGGSIFSNLYISDHAGREYVPAPLYINKLKKTKKYVCVAHDKYEDEAGNQPKKLIGKYLFWDENNISVLESQTDLIYHHSKKESFDLGRMGDDIDTGILYSQEVLKGNQIFSGNIIVKDKHKEIIMSLLKSPALRLGKSKSSQYGHCECNKIECNPYKNEGISLRQGERILVTFESDCIIPGTNGYTTHYEEIQEYIAGQFGRKLKCIEDAKVYMGTKVVAGYNGKINMKKSSAPAIIAGSAFEYEVAEDGVYDNCYIGCYISEGFGKVRLVKENDISYCLKESKLTEENETSAESKITEADNDIKKAINAIERDICKNRLLEDLKVYFIDKLADKNIKISSSLIGRLTLMLKETKNKSANDPKTNAIEDFAKRVASIKRDSERAEVISKLKNWKICNIELEKDENKNWKLKNVNNLLIKKEITEYLTDKTFGNLLDDDLKDLWADYLTFILLHMKYKKADEKQNSKEKATEGTGNE